MTAGVVVMSALFAAAIILFATAVRMLGRERSNVVGLLKLIRSCLVNGNVARALKLVDAALGLPPPAPEPIPDLETILERDELGEPKQ